ncbi:hypothetical protein Q1695_009728 [Nippostrongylus brasiliensis]|nr:hypothetical protein Q1695_009728 [Nippostrongylus brasiliensis]
MIIGPGEAPVLYLPLMGGCPNGVLKLLGIPTVVAIGVAYVVYYYKALSIAVLFYIRFDAILPRHYPFKPNRTPVFILFGVLHLTLTMLTPLVLYYIVPDQAAAKKKVLEEFPSAPPSVCLPETIFIEAPFAASTMLISVIFLLPSTVIILTSTYCVSHSFYYLHQQKYALSSKTAAMQRVILRSTIAEVCCSVMVLVIPAAAFFACFLASYCRQDLVNTSMFLIATHGTWETITILCVYKKYRQRILNMSSGFINTTMCGETTGTAKVTVQCYTYCYRRRVSVSYSYSSCFLCDSAQEL